MSHMNPAHALPSISRSSEWSGGTDTFEELRYRDDYYDLVF
jgi:hypothetical protein